MNLKGKRWKKWISFLCIVTMLVTMLQWTGTTMKVKAAEEYTAEQLQEMFPDENLLNAVYSSARIEVGNPISVSRLELIEYISLDGDNHNTPYETIDLTGISYLKNLTSISIGHFNVENEAFKNFDGLQLRSISVYWSSGLENLSYLSDWSQITTLRIDCDDFNSLAGFEKCTKLATLTLDSKSLSSLSGLSQCTALTYLSIYGDSLVDLTGLEQCTNLNQIRVRSDALTSLKGIENCTKLEVLDSSYNGRLSDISACANLTNLKNIDLYADDELSDISALANSNELVSLRIYSSKVGDISALKNKSNLKELDIGYTYVFREENAETSMEVLKTLTNLERLGLRGGRVNDTVFPIVCELKELVSLDLLSNSVSDLSKVGQLTKLRTIDIGSNSIVDFSPLAGLSELHGAHVSNVSPSIEYVKIDGDGYIFKNPVIGMDGKPVAPEEGEKYTYNVSDNTIAIKEEYKNQPDYYYTRMMEYTIEYVVPMDYNGNEFDIEVIVTYRLTPKKITITKQPENVECIEEEKAVFEVEAESEDDDFSYQWYKDGEAIEGGTEATLEISSAKLSDAGSYYCVISNATVSVTSNEATLTVKEKKPITITKQPENVECIEEEKAVFEVEAESEDDDFSYQWYKDGVAIEGATEATLEIGSATLEDAGNYYCVISNETMSATSDEATLTVKEKKPITITKQPENVECIEEEKVVFEVEAESEDDDFSYQWYKDGEAIEGATQSTLEIDSATLEDARSYYCVISNATVSVTSNEATLTVKEKKPITITKQPENVECIEEEKAVFEVEAESKDDDFSYQWYKDGVAIEGATEATLEISSATLEDAGNYYCVISNETMSATSNEATLTVKEKKPITITKQPENVECIEEEKAVFEVEAESEDDDFSYQWYKDGEVIEGGTEATLEISSATLEDAGSYYCVISNATVSLISNEAVLTVAKKQEPTTEEPTTEEPTTEEPTTEEPTTEEPTTEEPTTEKPVIEQVTTEQVPTSTQAVTEPVTTANSGTTPKTGDERNVAIITLLMISAVTAVLFGKRKINE